MKIFYSWQLDAKRKTNKDFIHSALCRAVDELGDELDLTEAERDEIEVDQDTQGVLGSPDIVQVILEKIAVSTVVVADVSLIGTGKDGKKHINSNVAIELGYTYGKRGDEAVLKVMNTYFGAADDLPFDLRTRRHPVQYSLDPDATKAEIDAEQKKLTRKFVSILKEYLARLPASSGESHVKTPSTYIRGAFWTQEEVIVSKDDTYLARDITCSVPSVIYFRCIPNKQLPQLTSLEARNATADLSPLLSEEGFSRRRNRWGAVSYCLASEGNFLGFTQVFKNREIWGVDAHYSNFTKLRGPEQKPQRFIPTGALQEGYPQTINEIRKTAKKLGYGDEFTIEMGISGASGLFLATKSSFWEDFPGPIHQDDVFVCQTVTKGLPTGEIMNAFWNKVFAEAGSEVPSYLKWLEQA